MDVHFCLPLITLAARSTLLPARARTRTDRGQGFFGDANGR